MMGGAPRTCSTTAARRSATGYADHWKFTLADGTSELHFDRLGYLDEALSSYEAFRAQRAAGSIAAGVRFMVAVPLPESATRPFIDRAPHWQLLWDGYVEALGRELRALAERIPHEDLAIQLDVCLETAAVEGIPVNFADDGLTRLPRDPLERYAAAVADIAAAIPTDVWLGLHVCYGSLGHEEGSSADSGHFKEIADLGVSVAIANAGARAAGRPLAFVHMPVQNSRGFADAFYAPLEGLDVGDARVYLGLIHLHDGMEGAMRRIELARRHLPSFGVATQCGWGRRPAGERIEDLLALHRDVADALAA